MTGRTIPAQFLEALERERRDYAAALPGRVQALRDSWRGIRSGHEPRAGLEGVERAAHGLAGSGAMFGFDRLSHEARILERALRGLIESADDTPGGGTQVEAAIGRLESSLADGAP